MQIPNTSYRFVQLEYLSFTKQHLPIPKKAVEKDKEHMVSL